MLTAMNKTVEEGDIASSFREGPTLGLALDKRP